MPLIWLPEEWKKEAQNGLPTRKRFVIILFGWRIAVTYKTRSHCPA